MTISKKNILNDCLEILKDKISTLNHELEEIKESSENEDKNSSGDKFETGLAMLHQQKEKLMVQLVDLFEMQNTLEQIDLKKKSDTVILGSVIETSTAIFFLSVQLGKITVKNQTLFALSIKSPIGKALLNKKIGDKLLFNGNTIEINGIY